MIGDSAITEAVAGFGSRLGALAVAGAATSLDVEFHHPLGDEAEHLAHQIVGPSLLKQLG